MAKNYYEILGIDKKAGKEEIKKAYHKLAHKYHPDKGGDASKFKEVSEAYSVLSDDRKRAEYDAYGQSFNGASGAQGFGGFDFSQFTQNGGQGFQQFDFEDLGDIFGDFFGGARRSQTARGRDISIDLELSFDESIFGVTRKVLLTKQSLCETCKGSGGKPGTEFKTCGTCNGKGQIHETKQSFFGSVSVSKVCGTCKGNGKIPKEQCQNCKGLGVERKQQEISIAVPAGIDNGEVIRMSGQGEAIMGGVAGDLYIKIHVKKHPTLMRDGVNLHTNLDVKLSDALLGADYRIDTLEGPLTVTVPAGIAFGETLRVRERGVPISKNRRGDLMIKVNILMPKKLSKHAKDLLEKLKEEGM